MYLPRFLQVDAMIKGFSPRAVFTEHQRVRLRRDLQSEGYYLRRDMFGTVLAVYDNGAAYAVEFAATNGETAVVTVDADVLAADAAE